MRNVDELASLLKKDPALYVTLIGFADRKGSTELNEQLARERAEHVADALVEAGVARERIAVETRGEDQSTAVADQGAQQLDRRVEAAVSRTAH